jgi:hypothetical protein
MTTYRLQFLAFCLLLTLFSLLKLEKKTRVVLFYWIWGKGSTCLDSFRAEYKNVFSILVYSLAVGGFVFVFALGEATFVYCET